MISEPKPDGRAEKAIHGRKTVLAGREQSIE